MALEDGFAPDTMLRLRCAELTRNVDDASLLYDWVTGQDKSPGDEDACKNDGGARVEIDAAGVRGYDAAGDKTFDTAPEPYVCPARTAIRGEVYACDVPYFAHRTHGNVDAGAIWADEPTDTVEKRDPVERLSDGAVFEVTVGAESIEPGVLLQAGSNGGLWWSIQDRSGHTLLWSHSKRKMRSPKSVLEKYGWLAEVEQ